MNIFYLSKDPKECTEFHNDKHVVKQILEYAQLLSTAHRVLDFPTGFHNNLYKLTHKNHPSAVWVRTSKENYKYTFKLLLELTKEYTHRYGKKHKTETLLEFLMYYPDGITKVEFTEPPKCMPEDFHKDSVVESYREYYRIGKQHLLQYTNRKEPKWL